MTERLYYQDAGLWAFDAIVRSCEAGDRHARVVLDRTAFYPTSGGQPFDTGQLGPVQVVEVEEREDGEIVHVVTGPLLAGQLVRGTIDPERRLDHMQQHTGQHVLSAAFDRLFGLATVSFHLGAEAATIDLSREASGDEVAAAEDEANRIVWEDRPVNARIVAADAAASLALRKPSARSGDLRIVEIDDFDRSACGGTHVSRTGQIGVIAIRGWERFKGGSRITFVCGRRALVSHRALREAVAGAVRVLSVPASQLGAQIERLQQELRDYERQVKLLHQELDGYRAREIRETAETIGGRQVVIRRDPRPDGATLKNLAQAVVSGTRLVAILIGDGQPAPVVIARGSDETIDAGALIKELVAAFGGRGGGRAEMAQGGIATGAEAIVTFVRQRLGS